MVLRAGCLKKRDVTPNYIIKMHGTTIKILDFVGHTFKNCEYAAEFNFYDANANQNKNPTKYNKAQSG
jgi:hypothetical protein